MAFPRPFNALVDYYMFSPPYCDGAEVTLEGIPIRQLKDYLPYYDEEANVFHRRMMVRWCIDADTTLFNFAEFPATNDPFPGYFVIQGSPFQFNAYQLVGVEPIMVSGDPTEVDYYYCILRQISSAEVPCGSSGSGSGGGGGGGVILIEGSASWETAPLLTLGQMYRTTVPEMSEIFFKFDADTSETHSIYVQGVTSNYLGDTYLRWNNPPDPPDLDWVGNVSDDFVPGVIQPLLSFADSPAEHEIVFKITQIT